MNTWHQVGMVSVLCGVLLCSCSSGSSDQAPSAPPKSSTGADAAKSEPLGNSFEERYQRDLIRCLRDAGWEAQYDSSDNTILLDKVPPEQQEARSADHDVCTTEATEKNPSKALTDADYKSLYQQELKAMKCLEAEGYPLSAQPISEQQYISEYKAGSPSWQAYQVVGAIPPEIEKKCPQPSVDQ